MKYSTFFLFCLQILAAQIKKKVEYFKVKWVDIADKGCTWEPLAHLIGDEAKQALHVFKEKRAAEAAAEAEARRARAAGADGAAAGVGNPTAAAGAAGATADSDVVIVEPTTKKPRRKSSSCWQFFNPKYYDPELKGHYAKCKLCQRPIKVVNTSNLTAHLNQKHPEEVCDEKEKVFKVKPLSTCLFSIFFLFCELLTLCFVQKMHCPIAELLPATDGQMTKFVGDHKKKCDRAYIVWCCKSCKPLSMAEKDSHFRSFLYSITNGR